MNTPKYSVVVPIHNIDEQYLKKCVESILGQILPDLELILVDDGSTDESGALCDSYVPRDARVRVFHKKNGGEDGKFHFDMALRGRICLLNEILMHYRIDVPAEKKARRQKTKSMQSAWVSHLNEYDELLKSRPEIRRYLDKLRLGTTLAYRGNPIFKNEIKAILRQVSPENWTLSFRLLHWVPYSFQKAISALWHRVKRVIR